MHEGRSFQIFFITYLLHVWEAFENLPCTVFNLRAVTFIYLFF